MLAQKKESTVESESCKEDVFYVSAVIYRSQMIITFLYIFHFLRTMTSEPRLNPNRGADGQTHDESAPRTSTNFGLGTQQPTKSPSEIPPTTPNSDHHESRNLSPNRQEMDGELVDLAADVYDIIKDIRDPEKPSTLEELQVVCEDGVHMTRQEHMEDAYTVHIAFTPTVPHCSLATLIGLCIRIKLERSLPYKHKVDIMIEKGTHTTEESINKQINDKERIAAAMENPNLRELVETCIKEDDY